MEKLKLNGIGSWGIPALIRDVFVNLWNDLSKKINEIIDSITTIETTVNAAPKELVYKALLTQVGGTAPVLARVLNASDSDFLGYINWERFDTGVYITRIPINYDNNFFSVFVSNTFNLATGRTSYNIVVSKEDSNTIIYIYIYDADNYPIDGEPYNTPIVIRVRQRPEVSPELLSIETNTAGDTLIATFNKEMSNYGLTDLISAITVSGSNTVTAIALNETDNTKVEFTLDALYTSTDIITFSFDVTKNWEALDLSLVEEIINYTVTNNVTPEE